MPADAETGAPAPPSPPTSAASPRSLSARLSRTLDRQTSLYAPSATTTVTPRVLSLQRSFLSDRDAAALVASARAGGGGGDRASHGHPHPHPKPPGLEPTRAGTFWTAALTVCAAVASFPVLSLPWAVASMGWGPGMAVMVASGLATAAVGVGALAETAAALAARDGGRRYDTYPSLTAAALGRRAGHAAAVAQAITLAGTLVATALLGGTSIKALVSLISAGRASLHLSAAVFVFAGALLPLTCIADMHESRWLMGVGVLSFVGVSLISLAASIHQAVAHPLPRGEHTPPPGSPATRVFAGLNGLGAIIFAFGLGVSAEVQSLLPDPGSARTMRAAASTAFCGAILPLYAAVGAAGYAAFGRTSKPVILASLTDAGTAPAALGVAWALALVNLVALYCAYAMPLFAWVDARVLRWKRGGGGGGGGGGRGGGGGAVTGSSPARTAARVGGRTLLLLATALVAAALPFFGDVMSALGASFLFLDFAGPAACYLAVVKTAGWGWRAAAAVTSVVYCLAGAAVVIAATRSIALNVRTYHLFADM